MRAKDEATVDEPQEPGDMPKKPWLQLRAGYAAARFSAVLFQLRSEGYNLRQQRSPVLLTFRGQSGPNLVACAVEDDGSREDFP